MVPAWAFGGSRTLSRVGEMPIGGTIESRDHVYPGTLGQAALSIADIVQVGEQLAGCFVSH